MVTSRAIRLPRMEGSSGPVKMAKSREPIEKLRLVSRANGRMSVAILVWYQRALMVDCGGDRFGGGGLWGLILWYWPGKKVIIIIRPSQGSSEPITKWVSEDRMVTCCLISSGL